MALRTDLDIYVLSLKTPLNKQEREQLLLMYAGLYTDKKLIIRRAKNNKPYFKNHKHLYFNVSHSYNKLVFCFAKKPVGVDIEKIQKRKQMNKISKRICNKKEFLEYKNSKNKMLQFYKLWTKKEAISKYLGHGFRYGFKRIDTFENLTYSKKIDNYMLSVFKP